MKRNFGSTFLLLVAASAWAQSPTKSPVHPEAEYYVRTYAQHYRVPVPLVRAVVEMESNWRACVVSSKGAVGLMQLRPATAERLGVRARCNIGQSGAGGVRSLAGVRRQCHGDLRSP